MRTAWIVVASLALACAPLAAQKSPELAGKTLEELMNIEVTSVSKKQQRLAHAAASVFVITQEDIRRSGLTSVPELLRMVPGVHVARIEDSLWAINIRGFNDQFGNKLLVMVDGRSVYSESYGGVYWEALETVLDNIERIEVIRGPGAAMWGANAVNGVINIITKRAEATQGGFAQAGHSALDLGFGGLRYGGQLGPNAFYRVHTLALGRQPMVSETGLRTTQDWVQANGGFRIDWTPTQGDSVLFEGEVYRGRSTEQHPDGLTPRPDATLNLPFHSGGADVLVQWQHRYSDHSLAQWQFSYSRMDRRFFDLPESFDIFAAGFQHRYSWGPRHELVWGGGYRMSAHRSQGQRFFYAPSGQNLNHVSGFLEDEFTLLPDKLALIAGTQFEHNSFTGFEVQPTARLLWTPTRHLASWAAVSRAVRTPSLVDRGLHGPIFSFFTPSHQLAVGTLEGAPTTESETVRSYEVGQRVQLRRRVSADASFFYSIYDHLRTTEQEPAKLVPPNPQSPVAYLLIANPFRNTRSGETYGGELSTNWTASDRWKLSAGYSLFHARLHDYPGRRYASATPVDVGSPRHQFQVASHLNLTSKLHLDTALYFTGRVRDRDIPSHLRGDLRLGWHPAENLEFSVGLQDAFDPRHPEFTSDRLVPKLEVRRGVFGNFVWRF